jgi:phosphate acetyltransferase
MLRDVLFAAARVHNARVVLPEGDDPRVIAAARQMVDEGIARPILIGESSQIDAVAQSIGITLDGVEIAQGNIDPNAAKLRELFANKRARASDEMKREVLDHPLHYGALLVAAGHADLMVAGAANATARVIAAGLQCIGLAPGISTASSFFLMDFDENHPIGPRTLIFADCAVVIDPSPTQLADITISTAANAELLLGNPPHIAMLSFSSHGSAKHPRVDYILEALELVQQRAPHITIDGELQFDTAFVEAIANKKLRTPGPVAGRADVFIFPDLEAGNIGYKLTQYLGGAQALGPILQGFAKPVADLSRGASTADIVLTTAATAAMVQA